MIEYKIYIKQGHDMKFRRIHTTQNPQTAEITAMSWCNSAEKVKIVCSDGCSEETLIYK